MSRAPRHAAIDWDGKKKVNLALQGGGSHGAFTWGVLDALLEDGRLDVEAISGTSAGAMNAAVYAQGYLEKGREGARERLASFWSQISAEGALSPWQRKLLDGILKPWSFEGTPAYWWLDFVTHYASPYDFNPLDINPLRDLLRRIIDFDKVRACEHIKLFIAATNVHTGKIAIFDRERLTADHLMASACLPYIFRAVEIDGVPYWDGGYMGNPALFPLFYETACPDVVLVQINPLERNETPRTARDIQNRINEISFNSTLMREMRAVEFVQRLVDQGQLPEERYMRVFIHRIDGAEPLKAFSAASKFDSSWESLTAMRDIGRAAAKQWLEKNYDAIGVRDTVDVRAEYL
jgi:NTE family protein